MKTPRRRLLPAAVTALALMLVLAAPALATPVNTTAPTIAAGPNGAFTGQDVTCDDGTWTNGDSFDYRFVRDRGTGGAVTVQDFGNGPTYVLTAADVGHTIGCVVEATDFGDGSTAQASS